MTISNTFNREWVQLLVEHLEERLTETTDASMKTARGIAACLCSERFPAQLDTIFHGMSTRGKCVILDSLFPPRVKKHQIRNILLNAIANNDRDVRIAALLTAARFGISNIVLQRLENKAIKPNEEESQAIAISCIQTLHPHKVKDMLNLLIYSPIPYRHIFKMATQGLMPQGGRQLLFQIVKDILTKKRRYAALCRIVYITIISFLLGVWLFPNWIVRSLIAGGLSLLLECLFGVFMYHFSKNKKPSEHYANR